MTFKKSRIRETLNLSTDADRRTDTILERLRDLSRKKKKKKGRLTRPRIHATDPRGAMDALHPPPVFRAPCVGNGRMADGCVGDGRSAPTPGF